ncbi:unnamed protein product [Heligmosomoides polygyrus]|uniref:AAA_11 domain-containing protein n=1 Tax=Heligmosomoides polygyrus TaxID=6339 RepID=A0A3P8ATF4_HELPZ|nr:unnamed protein product [Heligmosomoides polygyrus]
MCCQIVKRQHGFLDICGLIARVIHDASATIGMEYTRTLKTRCIAAFGTGKTVVGACIAARQGRGGSRIIVTATTNAAVAQITETILSIDAFADVAVCRYIAGSVVFGDSIVAIPANTHEILKRLPDLYRNELEEKALDECERFSEQEREDLVLAEKNVSYLIDKVIEVMFLKYQPQVVAITTDCHAFSDPIDSSEPSRGAIGEMRRGDNGGRRLGGRRRGRGVERQQADG